MFQLDGLFGRPSKKENVRVGAGYKPRPHSDGDLSEQDIHEKLIVDLNEPQLNEKLEEILVSFFYKFSLATFKEPLGSWIYL